MRRFARCFTVVLILLAVSAVPSPAQEKRPMTFMDVIELRSVGNGSISPDGKWVLYTISIPNWKAGRNFTDIFLAPADGSAPPRQMTYTKEKNETSPQWARDSRSFAFLSDRSEKQQVYLMRVDGGEARQISNAKDGVTAFAFSRDGRWLAFSAGKPEERQIWLADLTKDEPAVQLTRHSTPIASFQWSYDSTRIFFLAPDTFDRDDVKRKEKKFDVRIADEVRPPQHLWSVAISDKSEKRWTSGDAFSVGQFTQSPNGEWIAFRSYSNDRHANRVTQDEAEIYLLRLTSGELRRLTSNNVGEGLGRFSPDSRWFVFTAEDDFEDMRNSKFHLVSLPGGEIRKLLADFDYNAGGASWSADARSFYFSTGVGTDSHLYSVTVPEGKLTQLTRERGVLSGSFDHETGMFLLSFTDPSHPGDYYVARPETVHQRSRWIRVSDANPQVAQFQLGEFETVRWKSSDGREVEGILVKPVKYEAGKRYPLVVQIHGGPAGADMNSFNAGYGSYVHIFAANGYAVLKPNYRGSDQYGEKFRMQIAGDYFHQAYDDIMTGVEYLIARGIADPDRLGMMGWSAGGHWSNWTMTHTDRFKAFSTGAGAVNWISMYAQTDVQSPREFYFKGKPYDNWDHYVEVSPLKYIKNAKTPTLIHVCEGDPRVPKPQSDELHMALKKHGVPVEYIIYPQNTHGITDPRYQMVKMVAEFNWFEKWLKGKPGWFEWKSLLATLEEPAKGEEKKSASTDEPER
jgi:dipeptidyl aminopeptidase/acylaminoacyl peptidase